jgi:hypothetical protein
MADFTQQIYNADFNIKLPADPDGKYTNAIRNINETSEARSARLKKGSQGRIGKSLIKTGLRTAGLQIASELYIAQRQHDIKMIGVVQGDSYKQQVANFTKKMLEDPIINAIRTGASATLYSGNPLVGLAAGAISAGSSYAGIGLEAMYADKEADTLRSIDALNVGLARRALSVGSTYGSRNVQNKGVMY